jgi:hypothetical protein
MESPGQDGSAKPGCKEDESRFSCRHFVAGAWRRHASFATLRLGSFQCGRTK